MTRIFSIPLIFGLSVLLSGCYTMIPLMPSDLISYYPALPPSGQVGQFYEVVVLSSHSAKRITESYETLNFEIVPENGLNVTEVDCSQSDMSADDIRFYLSQGGYCFKISGTPHTAGKVRLIITGKEENVMRVFPFEIKP